MLLFGDPFLDFIKVLHAYVAATKMPSPLNPMPMYHEQRYPFKGLAPPSFTLDSIVPAIPKPIDIE